MPSHRTAAVLLCALLGAAPLAGQTRDPGTLVIVTGQQATMPVPTLMEGPQNLTANFDVADQLFLRLAELPPDLVTTDERRFVPLREIGSLSGRIPPGKVTTRTEKEYPLWCTKFMLILFGGLLLVEWTLRKVNKMI